MPKYKIDQKSINQLYQLLKDTHDIMTHFEVTYWIDGGTSLGAVRHKGIIPWDDDVDISIMYSKKVNRLFDSKKFKQYLALYNYGIVKTNYDYKIYRLDGIPMKLNPWKEHWKLFQVNHPEIKGRSAIWKAASKTYSKKQQDRNYAFPFLDIFTMKKKDNELIYMNTWWDKCRYTIGEMFPLKQYPFLTYTVWGPNNPEQYFDRCYGKDWRKFGYIYLDHVNTHVTSGKKKIKIKLQNKPNPAKCTINIE